MKRILMCLCFLGLTSCAVYPTPYGPAVAPLPPYPAYQYGGYRDPYWRYPYRYRRVYP